MYMGYLMENINNDNKKIQKILFMYILPVLVVLILCLIPIFLIPYSDYMNKTFVKKMPVLNSLTNIYKDKLIEANKLPFYLVFETDKELYLPYEPIIINLVLIDISNQNIPNNLYPEIIIKDKNNNILKDILQRDQITMKYSSNQNIYIVEWFPDNNNYIGQIEICMNLNIGVFDKIITRKKMVVINRLNPPIIFTNAYTFLSLDSKEEVDLRQILSVKGKETDISKLSEWFKLLGNDAVMMPIGITKTFADKQKRYSVWDINKKKETEKYAKEYKKNKLDIALWVQSLELEGSNKEYLNYQESQKESDDHSENIIVSLKDKKRFNDIQQLLNELLKNDAVTYIGLSELFFNNNDYHRELFGDFVKQFPDNVSSEIRENAFNKWNNFQMVNYLRDLIQPIGNIKPIFLILEVEDVLKNPEYLLMAFSSGIDFVMLNINNSHHFFERDWEFLQKNTLLQEYIPNIVFSYTVNYDFFVNGESSALENWKDANLYILNKYKFPALQIQDFYRTMFGNRGVYPAYEWMLMTGGLITQWKDDNQLYPIKQSLIPNTKYIGSNLIINIELKNISSKNISNLVIELLPTMKYDKKQRNILTIIAISTGDIIRTNILLSNVKFNQGILKKHSRFVGFKTSYQLTNKIYQQIKMIPFIDQSTEIDKLYSTDKDFDEELRLLRQEDLKKEEKRRLYLEALKADLLRSNTNLIDTKDDENEDNDKKNKKKDK